MPDEERLTRAVLVRLSEKQHWELERAADREPLAAWIRRAALRAAKAQARKGARR